MADFSQAGEDGALPDDFRTWASGVTYTVRPELLEPLGPLRRVAVNATVRRTAAAHGAAPHYADLYARARTIAQDRAAALTCAAVDAPRRTWIVAHAWLSQAMGPNRLDSATITLGVTFAPDGVPVPSGEQPPAERALSVRSGGSAEAYAARHADESGSRRLDEIYIEFAAVEGSRDVTISYGEYVATDAIGFSPIVDRAERLARSHATRTAPPESGLRILQREWACLSTGKADGSRIAAVHLFGRIE